MKTNRLFLTLAVIFNLGMPIVQAEGEVPKTLDHLPAKEQFEPWQGQEGELRLRSFGDFLIHDRVSWMADKSSWLYEDAIARLEAEGLWEDGMVPGAEEVSATIAGSEDYDFMPMLARIAPFTSYADVTVANLEIIAAYPDLPISGYPQFNAPGSVLEAMKAIGVDLVSNATNHTLDWFSDGAISSINNLETLDILYSGSYKDQDDFQTPRIIEKNGIKLGFLSYTYGTNGIPIPYGEEYIVSMLDLDVILSEVEWLKPQVDAVVVTLHMGPEYGEWPDDQQQYYFQALSDAGVKLILGGHPHVLQPLAWLNEDETFAIYSQASFLTGQRELENKQGGITEVTFKKDEQGEVYVTNPKFMPTFVLGVEAEKMYETVPLADYDRYAIPDGAWWWDTLSARMTQLTDQVDIVTHLETQWTQESK
ncbi:CapA family protein [Fundicoccus sp. Sow4_H7]|uniref:CapA family protein n=1 Tax=Fundicoccus sp. Sow4_H7 TaxID=3438784 RepID=UPI003F925241